MCTFRCFSISFALLVHILWVEDDPRTDALVLGTFIHRYIRNDNSATGLHACFQGVALTLCCPPPATCLVVWGMGGNIFREHILGPSVWPHHPPLGHTAQESLLPHCGHFFSSSMFHLERGETKKLMVGDPWVSSSIWSGDAQPPCRAGQAIEKVHIYKGVTCPIAYVRCGAQ